MPEAEYLQKLEEGINFYNQKNIPKAILTFRDALAMSDGASADEIAKGHYYLAASYFENENYDEAADHLPECGAYAPLKVFSLIKEIAGKVNIDYKKIIDELPQKQLYMAIIKEEEDRRREAAAAAAEDNKAKAEKERLRKEAEGDYDNLFVETMHSAPTNYIIPVFMGLISIPAWGLGVLLAFQLPKAIIRFALEYIFYYLYINKAVVQSWIVNNINLSAMFGYTPFINNLNEWVFPALQAVYIALAAMFSLQSYVYGYFAWYKIFLAGNVTEIRNNVDVYINAGFNQHLDIGNVFYVYSRGMKPVCKGTATVLRIEDDLSLVEFRPSLESKEIMHPKIGDFIRYKW